MDYISIRKLQDLLNNNYEIVKVYPPIIGSDVEINIVIISLISKNEEKKETIRAYGQESHELREYIRKNKLYQESY
ncbi:MAG: hypothetical protein ACPKPY_06940 [Nitrososphaeraceae archaeon]